MRYECQLSEQSLQTVISIRTRVSVQELTRVLGYCYGAIMKYLDEVGERPSGAPFVAYYNMDMQDLDIEVGFPISTNLPGNGEVVLSKIPGGKQASCIYIGPYSKMEPAYNALMQYITEKGFTPTGTSYEFYLNDPGETPEDKLETRIVFPLK